MNEAIEPAGGGGRAYGAGVTVALVTALLLVWTTIVRDDGSGQGFFLVIMAAGVGGWAVRFTADGMARTMVGVAAMQATFGLAVATAPITASAPGAVGQVVIYNAVFTVLWLVAAALFRAATLTPTRKR